MSVGHCAIVESVVVGVGKVLAEEGLSVGDDLDVVPQRNLRIAVLLAHVGAQAELAVGKVALAVVYEYVVDIGAGTFAVVVNLYAQMVCLVVLQIDNACQVLVLKTLAARIPAVRAETGIVALGVELPHVEV